MNLRLNKFLFVFALAAGCSAKYSSVSNDTKIPVPAFEIRIALTDRAAKKLRDAGESIEGAVIFDGDGKSKRGEDMAPLRSVYLGVYSFQRAGACTVFVTNAVISAEAVQRLTNSDYYYTVNVASGRHVFADNILDGGFAAGHISDAVKAPIEIKCDLIEK